MSNTATDIEGLLLWTALAVPEKVTTRGFSPEGIFQPTKESPGIS